METQSAINPIISQDNRNVCDFILVNSGNVRTKALDELDLNLIRSCIDIYGNNQTKIAEVLGLNRGTLRKRMSELGFFVNKS
ncbi:helix-turn-helix domain-containing protein [Acinetobacter bereziniae]|uniref:helix-turn-helix domain-containing protein n=1 Tax=Acinetobacter bereziniae TaxID=106648 RepID=UPI00124FAED3|nr:helix-turn-helix domain-containing protein [Acinetobacter bereziniae]